MASPSPKPRRFEGSVVRRAAARGSKSEREAVVLDTDEGSFILRRQGGNAFSDPELDALVGHRVRARGYLSGTTLIAVALERLEDPA